MTTITIGGLHAGTVDWRDDSIADVACYGDQIDVIETYTAACHDGADLDDLAVVYTAHHGRYVVGPRQALIDAGELEELDTAPCEYSPYPDSD